VLPDVWPPKIEALTLEPPPVPHLKKPPEVIQIDVGRQLFVDGFLIEETNLQRVSHMAEYHPGIREDRTLHAAKWQGGKRLVRGGRPAGQVPVLLEQGPALCIWVSPEPSGASHGYVAAGCPGFSEPMDTLGAGAPGRQWDGPVHVQAGCDCHALGDLACGVRLSCSSVLLINEASTPPATLAHASLHTSPAGKRWRSLVRRDHP
jgi:hypothetical protein